MTKFITIKIEEYGADKPKIVKYDDNSYDNVGDYARFFNSSSPLWVEDSERNLCLLQQTQQYANEMLRTRGHLFLNEVYDLLGMVRSRAGTVVGWTYKKNDPCGDNRVDFGIFEEHNQDFVNGNDTSVLLDFNVDGCILDSLII